MWSCKKSLQQMVPHSGLLVTYLEMECGPGKLVQSFVQILQRFLAKDFIS